MTAEAFKGALTNAIPPTPFSLCLPETESFPFPQHHADKQKLKVTVDQSWGSYNKWILSEEQHEGETSLTPTS